MTDRRAFLKKIAAAAAGASVLGSAAAEPGQKKFSNVGIITGTLKNEMKEDYRATLKAIAEMGYTCIEGGVPEGLAPTAYRKFLQDIGLRPIATGASMSPLQKELDKYLKTAGELKAEYLVCYYPWLTSADNLTTKEVMEAANNINTIGRRVKEAGFRFAWHNHAKEFVLVDGQMAFYTLMENTDPAYSTVQLDWYWVVKGGQDPTAYFRKYPGRFELAHVKDMNNNTDGGISCVGNGIIDFAPMFAAAKTGGVKYFIVENERAVKGLKCAQDSINHLTNFLT